MDRHIGLGSQLAAWSSPAGRPGCRRPAGGSGWRPLGPDRALRNPELVPGSPRRVFSDCPADRLHGRGSCMRPGSTGGQAARPYHSVHLKDPPIGTMSDPIWKNSRPGAGRDGTAIDCARTKNTQITHRPHPRAVPRRSGLHPSGLHPSGRRRTGGYWPSRRPQGRHQSGRRL